jgi:hypothetical protein
VVLYRQVPEKLRKTKDVRIIGVLARIRTKYVSEVLLVVRFLHSFPRSSLYLSFSLFSHFVFSLLASLRLFPPKIIVSNSIIDQISLFSFLGTLTRQRIQWKYSRKEINNQNNDVPKSTEDKVYSAVVSPVTKLLPDDGPYVAETCCKYKNDCKS